MVAFDCSLAGEESCWSSGVQETERKEICVDAQELIGKERRKAIERNQESRRLLTEGIPTLKNERA
jgi:hypothetical protein